MNLDRSLVVSKIHNVHMELQVEDYLPGYTKLQPSPIGYTFSVIAAKTENHIPQIQDHLWKCPRHISTCTASTRLITAASPRCVFRASHSVALSHMFGNRPHIGRNFQLIWLQVLSLLSYSLDQSPHPLTL